MSHNKVFDEKIIKSDFPFQRTENLPASDMIATYFKAKRGLTKKWVDYYGVMYCNWILLYPTTQGKLPKLTDEPQEGIKLDAQFSYKQVGGVDSRVLISGLIPKTKKFRNTLGIGTEADEWYIQFEDDIELHKWIEKVRKRCKELRKIIRSIGSRDSHSIITQIQIQTPINHHALMNPPKRYEEMIWTETIEELWNQLNTYHSDLSNLSLFAENFTIEYAPYLIWFTAPGSAPSSFEKDLLNAEDKVVVKGWQAQFTSFERMDNLIAITSDISEKSKLVQECKYMIHLIDCWNDYSMQIHYGEDEWEKERNRWELNIQRIEGLIDEETMKQQQMELDKESRERALQKALEDEQLDEAAKEEEIKNDPFSQQNLYKKETDPFQEIMLLEIADMYGDIDGEVWSQAVQQESEEEVDDIYDSLLNDLDVDLLGDNFDSLETFTLPNM